jgi:hypothetical protein
MTLNVHFAEQLTNDRLREEKAQKRMLATS